MCLNFLHLKHTKSFFFSYFSLSPWDENSFLKKSLLEMNILPLNFSPLMNLFNFLMMRVKSSSSLLCFSSWTSYSSLVVALRAMLFFLFSSSSCYFFTKLNSYVINDLMSSSIGSLVKSLAFWIAVIFVCHFDGSDLKIFISFLDSL